MIDRRDPERERLRAEAEARLAACWRDGLIGDATYLRSLMILGSGDDEARVELSLRKMERSRRCAGNQ